VPKTANKIVVIGGSAGALQALETLFARVPSELPATIFVVLHLASHLPSNLPRILSSLDGWVARNPMAEEKIEPGAVYVASPDRHMLIEKGRVKSVMGPKENRHRPAVNVLFRSAAYEYGGKVIGVVLSGSLDDGTSGLWEIKRRGGVAIVQDPTDAVHPWMPRSAIENADVDYVRPVAEIPELLVSLCSSEVSR
jgi:two-component system chemotaxis response regulator CheB